MVLFFFSSRRRHTRLVSDWSSDVCSSDLSRSPDARRTNSGSSRPTARIARTGELTPPGMSSCARSEERRVGKECRARWVRQDDEKDGEIKEEHASSQIRCEQRTGMDDATG